MAGIESSQQPPAEGSASAAPADRDTVDRETVDRETVDRETADRVAVGRINGTWGVRGHVKVTALTNNPERLATGAAVFVAGVPHTIADVRSPRGFPVIRFDGINSTEAAEELRDALIEIDQEHLPELPEGEFYVHDLVGLTVATTDGQELGRLDDVLRTGSNDVYLVTRPGAKDLLIPALEDVIVEVDLEAGRMVIDPIPGLLDSPADAANDEE